MTSPSWEWSATHTHTLNLVNAATTRTNSDTQKHKKANKTRCSKDPIQVNAQNRTYNVISGLLAVTCNRRNFHPKQPFEILYVFETLIWTQLEPLLISFEEFHKQNAQTAQMNQVLFKTFKKHKTETAFSFFSVSVKERWFGFFNLQDSYGRTERRETASCENIMKNMQKISPFWFFNLRTLCRFKHFNISPGHSSNDPSVLSSCWIWVRTFRGS